MVRLTGRPDMTLDVYRGRKTTKQQQLQQLTGICNFSSSFSNIMNFTYHACHHLLLNTPVLNLFITENVLKAIFFIVLRFDLSLKLDLNLWTNISIELTGE